MTNGLQFSRIEDLSSLEIRLRFSSEAFLVKQEHAPYKLTFINQFKGMLLA
jgi:hypothetical protein